MHGQTHSKFICEIFDLLLVSILNIFRSFNYDLALLTPHAISEF